MRKELIISTIPQETRVALIEDDELVEFLIERHRAQGIVGNIYKGRVTKVLPGMQSAFVNIGLDRDAFLYVSDFVEDGDEYERIVSTAEDEAFREPASGAGPSRPGSRPLRRGMRPGAVAPEEKAPAAETEPVPSGPVAAPPEESPEPPAPEPRPREPERAEWPRRTERRRGRIPSFEAREEAAPGSLEVLPGETLAKYRGRTTPQEAARAGADTAGERAAEPATAGPPASQARPLQSSATEAEGSDRPPAKDDDPPPPAGTRDEPAGQADDRERPAEASVTARTGPAAGEGALPDSDAEERDPADVSPDGGAEDSAGSSSEASISDPRRSGKFSRRPPARRPRRRQSSKSDARGGTSSPEPKISDLLREGQEILVQVSKEPLGRKGARITSHIALPGRYLVYMPTVDHVGVSRKISTEDERTRLRQIINANRDGLPGGFIVRTAAEGRGEEEFVQDLRFLADLWKEIREKSEQSSAPALIHSDLNLIQRVLRDQLSDEFRAIRLDNEVEYTRVLEFVSRFQPSLVNRVRLHLKDTPILEEYGLQQEIDKAMKSKVWLKSGGYIVINQTEALVAIDVNTGKFVGKSNRLEDTIVKTNIDAVHEIVRQVRLRNLGGIIVVDFIDMEERKNRQRVMQALEEELRKDKSPSKILQFNDFGLVAITRKRTQPSLERVLGRPCPRCAGAGFVKGIETVCYEIQQEVRKMLSQTEGQELTVRVNPEVAKAIKSGEYVDFTELEEEARKDIRIQGDPALEAERFDIF